MKKTPMRMCVACRQMREKKQLIRVVRTPQGEVKLDMSGRMNGRGAYLCRDAACLQRAIKTRALDRALDMRLGEQTAAALEEALAGDGSGTTA